MLYVPSRMTPSLVRARPLPGRGQADPEGGGDACGPGCRRSRQPPAAVRAAPAASPSALKWTDCPDLQAARTPGDSDST